MYQEPGAGGRLERLVSGRVIGMPVGVDNMGYPALHSLGFR